MKKIFVLLVVCFAFVQVLLAQTGAEWFSQKKTQISYLSQSIAALELYNGYAIKGIHIADQGLTAISDLQNGEFGSHKKYFTSLEVVNPVIAKDARISEMIAWQGAIVSQYQKTYSQVKRSPNFSGDEIKYIQTVFTNLLVDCSRTIMDLTNLITPGYCQLTDDQRMHRIDLAYQNMRDAYLFSQSFSSESNQMALTRANMQSDISRLKKLYQIK